MPEGEIKEENISEEEGTFFRPDSRPSPDERNLREKLKVQSREGKYLGGGPRKRKVGRLGRRG